MRFIKVLLIATMLVWAPVMADSVAHAEGGRAVASEKAKKSKKAKAGKAKKAKKTAKMKAKKAGKKAASKGKAKAKKAKKVASAKKPKSHAPAEHHHDAADSAADPAENFEISPEMQDELPAPNNGDLTE